MLLLLDANVLISAVLSATGPCADLLRLVRAGRVDAVVSPGLLEELNGVLFRAKFARLLPRDAAQRYLEELPTLCRLIPDARAVPGVTRDPQDDYLVALAVAAGVDVLVSGDKDLLAVDPAVVRVLTPREALGELGR